MPNHDTDQGAPLDPEIWAKVQDAFAGALGLELDEIEPQHRIIGDLEAESLDFLDIAFRLERAFEIKIPRGGIEKAAQEGGDGMDEDGRLTAQGVSRLSAEMPEVPSEEIHVGMRITEIPQLFRVMTFYNLVVRIMAAQAAA